MRDLFDTSIILPKLWLARIPKYWDETIPTDIPKSSSSFSYVSTEAEKEAVKEMEENISDPEKSIITPEALGEHNALGSYAGTYDVVADAGVRTLLSPNKLTNAIGALAYHYDDEADEWTQIEDVELDKDGYVWGSCEEFSPIAVFGIRRDSYVDESQSLYKFPVFVCNGIFTKFYKNDEDKIVAEDGYGKITEIAENYLILGGTYDGTDVESTNISVVGINIGKIIGGSAFLDHPVHVGTVNMNIKDTKSTSAITGVGVGCRVEKVNMTIDGCESNGLGCTESYYQNKCLNKTLEDSHLRLGAPQWTKEGVINVTNSKIQVAYASANNGYSYVKDAKMYADNCEFEWLCCGQSNGTVDNAYLVISNSKVKYFNTANRGYCGDAKSIVKGCEIENAYILGDLDELTNRELAKPEGKVYVDYDANCKIDNLCVGCVGEPGNGHVVETYEEAVQLISAVKISRDAQVTYAEGTEATLGDLLAIK